MTTTTASVSDTQREYVFCNKCMFYFMTLENLRLQVQLILTVQATILRIIQHSEKFYMVDLKQFGL